MFCFYLFLTSVPPRRVEILYQSHGGDTYRASESEVVRLPHGVITTVTCRVKIDDTDLEPDVIVTSDGLDMTSHFTENSTTTIDVSLVAIDSLFLATCCEMISA